MYLVHIWLIGKFGTYMPRQISGSMVRQHSQNSGFFKLRETPCRTANLLAVYKAALLQADGDEHGTGGHGGHALRQKAQRRCQNYSIELFRIHGAISYIQLLTYRYTQIIYIYKSISI
jgi:hypothetical protein